MGEKHPNGEEEVMHRNSQWEDEVIDLENQITYLLKKIEDAKNHITPKNLSIYGLDLRKYARVNINPIDLHAFLRALTNILEAEP